MARDPNRFADPDHRQLAIAGHLIGIRARDPERLGDLGDPEQQ
jgi:hypothetical protein